MLAPPGKNVTGSGYDSVAGVVKWRQQVIAEGAEWTRLDGWIGGEWRLVEVSGSVVTFSSWPRCCFTLQEWTAIGSSGQMDDAPQNAHQQHSAESSDSRSTESLVTPHHSTPLHSIPLHHQRGHVNNCPGSAASSAALIFAPSASTQPSAGGCVADTTTHLSTPHN